MSSGPSKSFEAPVFTVISEEDRLSTLNCGPVIDPSTPKSLTTYRPYSTYMCIYVCRSLFLLQPTLSPLICAFVSLWLFSVWWSLTSRFVAMLPLKTFVALQDGGSTICEFVNKYTFEHRLKNREAETAALKPVFTRLAPEAIDSLSRCWRVIRSRQPFSGSLSLSCSLLFLASTSKDISPLIRGFHTYY